MVHAAAAASLEGSGQLTGKRTSNLGGKWAARQNLLERHGAERFEHHVPGAVLFADAKYARKARVRHKSCATGGVQDLFALSSGNGQDIDTALKNGVSATPHPDSRRAGFEELSYAETTREQRAGLYGIGGQHVALSCRSNGLRAPATQHCHRTHAGGNWPQDGPEPAGENLKLGHANLPGDHHVDHRHHSADHGHLDDRHDEVLVGAPEVHRAEAEQHGRGHGHRQSQIGQQHAGAIKAGHPTAQAKVANQRTHGGGQGHRGGGRHDPPGGRQEEVAEHRATGHDQSHRNLNVEQRFGVFVGVVHALHHGPEAQGWKPHHESNNHGAKRLGCRKTSDAQLDRASDRNRQHGQHGAGQNGEHAHGAQTERQVGANPGAVLGRGFGRDPGEQGGDQRDHDERLRKHEHREGKAVHGATGHNLAVCHGSARSVGDVRDRNEADLPDAESSEGPHRHATGATKPLKTPGRAIAEARAMQRNEQDQSLGHHAERGDDAEEHDPVRAELLHGEFTVGHPAEDREIDAEAGDGHHVVERRSPHVRTEVGPRVEHLSHQRVHPVEEHLRDAPEREGVGNRKPLTQAATKQSDQEWSRRRE